MFKHTEREPIDFGKDGIFHTLLRLAPPVMLAQLIQALYNIIDSFFIGKNSEDGLTALSIIYPIQLLMIALAVGTGVGINTLMAHYSGVGKKQESEEAAGTGTVLAVILWAVFAAVCFFIMPAYARMSTNSENVIKDVVLYGRVVCVFSIGLFLESIWTKVLQASGNMQLPMIAQIVGAIINIILDPILIFGLGGIPAMGIAGAAIATVSGQIAAALIVMKKGFKKSLEVRKYIDYIKRIYHFGFPNILMQSAYTFYILGLNLILKGFSNQAITALGLYYKWQTFFFIPLGALQTCIVPVLSYNYSSGKMDRCKRTLRNAVIMGLVLMFVGTLCFELIPSQLLGVFSNDATVISIGTIGFRIIGISFLPMVTSLIFPVYFQAIGSSFQSSFLTIIRTVVLFVPLGWLFSRTGLHNFWLTFPVTETLTTLFGFLFYKKSMLKKSTIAIALLAVCTTSLSGCGQYGINQSDHDVVPEHVFVYAENQSEDYPTTLGAYKFAQLVEERTNGKIKIVVRINGELGDETSVVEQMQFGGVDMARISVSPLAEFIPELNVLQMPYLYSNKEIMWKALDGEIGQKFKDAVQQKNINLRLLSWYDSGTRNFYSSKPIGCLSDLKGLNIRIQESDLMKEMISILGANPIKLIYSDVYQSLQTGTIDAAENNWPSYEYAKHNEVAPFCLVDEHSRIPEVQIISDSAWNQLTSDQQEIINQCSQESAVYERELWNESEEKARQDVEKKGAVLTYISDEDLKEFQDAVQPLYDHYCADYMDIIQQIKSME